MASQQEAASGNAEPGPSSRRAARKAMAKNGIDTDIPPLSTPFDIFEDLLKRCLELGHTNIFDDKPLHIKVATVCSGTDSPIFALKLMTEAARNLGKPFMTFDHVFSSEIEPYKQAFIKRNTDQSIIFRDVTELGARGASQA
jgi:hypothetical protein